MEIRELADIDMAAMLPIYEAVGWTNYTDKSDMLRLALENSLLTLGAYDANRLVGLVRAVGDGYSIVFVQDILVLPDYHRRGIGTRLLRAVIDRFPSVYQMELLTDDTPETAAFYRSMGFSPAGEIGCMAFIRM